MRVPSLQTFDVVLFIDDTQPGTGQAGGQQALNTVRGAGKRCLCVIGDAFELSHNEVLFIIENGDGDARASVLLIHR